MQLDIYTHRKNNWQKVEPAHCTITKRDFISPDSCFCEKYRMILRPRDHVTLKALQNESIVQMFSICSYYIRSSHIKLITLLFLIEINFTFPTIIRPILG